MARAKSGGPGMGAQTGGKSAPGKERAAAPRYFVTPSKIFANAKSTLSTVLHVLKSALPWHV